MYISSDCCSKIEKSKIKFYQYQVCNVFEGQEKKGSVRKYCSGRKGEEEKSGSRSRDLVPTVGYGQVS